MRRLAFYRFASIHRYYGLILLLAFVGFVFYIASRDVKSNFDAPSTTRPFTYSNFPEKVDEQVLLLLKRGLISKDNGSMEIRPIFKPSLFGDNLPHLFDYENVNPKVYLTAPANFFRSPPTLIIAIPTVKRDVASYYKQTIENLMNGLQEYEFYHVLFLIYIAEHPHNNEYTLEIVNWLKATYPKAVEHGLFEVIEAPGYYFPPNLNQTAPTFNDSQERMTWRTKQNLDYAYMMIYARLAHVNSHFYIQLEDDVLATTGYVTHILNYLGLNPDFFSCEFSQLGFIGKLFRVSDLHLLTDSILMFHKDKPTDWILGDVFYSRFCSPESKDCAKQINALHRFIRKPALFQHIGRHSSLRNKVQPLREKIFQHGEKPILEEHVVNDYKDVQITTIPDLKLNPEALTKFFKHGLPLQFDNSPSGLEVQINFDESIQMRQVEVRFAAKYGATLVDLPLIVEFTKANSTTGYQQLNTTSRFLFHYEGAQQIWISSLRIVCQRSFDYLAVEKLTELGGRSWLEELKSKPYKEASNALISNFTEIGKKI